MMETREQEGGRVHVNKVLQEQTRLQTRLPTHLPRASRRASTGAHRDEACQSLLKPDLYSTGEAEKTTEFPTHCLTKPLTCNFGFLFVCCFSFSYPYPLPTYTKTQAESPIH